jgi:2-polyprenyl-3-methyl-5-hydroxy-6-metoxy-1,4-benzoquinol methylase
LKYPDNDAENDHLARIADQMNNITEKDYWDNFWMHLSLPCRVDENFSNDLNISEFLKQYVPSGENRKIALEVGCAPGKWMIFLNDELQYSVEGCEYLESAVKITRQNLEMNNIDNAVIHQGDFLSYDFGKNQYDVVISLGFIEHFTNPESVVEKMCTILKKGGILIIGIPKFTGLNYYIAKYVDKKLKNKLLPAHNLKIMHLHFFYEVAKKCQVKPIKITCSGGFEPALYDTSATPFWFNLIFHGLTIIFHNRLSQIISSEFYSSYILAAYKKV